jgi:small subunit ribosomal protein S2
MNVLPKKEVAQLLGDEKEKLQRFLGGIKDMEKLPGALFVIDPRKETDCRRGSPQTRQSRW